MLYGAALSHYASAFRHLHRAKLQGMGAPHKPVLLLAVMDEIEDGTIRENRIFIAAELVARFKDTWSRLVRVQCVVPVWGAGGRSTSTRVSGG